MLTTDELPDDVEALKALVLEERAARLAIDAALLASHAECVALEAVRKDRDATIAYLQLQIQKMQRDKFGRSSERTKHLLEQFQLALEDIDGDLAEAEEKVDAAATKVGPHTRRQPKRGPLPEHLSRERIVIPAPQACPCCGSDKLSKLGEDVTETLDVIPLQCIVRQTVRERFSCRACETITQPPAPFHVIARGRAGPSLLAMILWSKYVMHLPL
ncbi:MAG: IS66 family transposase zinc-finger binding domain-containing protein, partial [Hyphomonas sp.]|nr:IS66 family transposase zinc-finger binding domain-containing protein [Hyphomonas sp.]